MKTEMKVLLYLKRNGQDESGLCPLMRKITVKGKYNSSTQIGCKVKVNPKSWNATLQRCTGKSHTAVKTNKEIEMLMLLLLAQINELAELNEKVSAEDVKNFFQVITAAQMTLLKLFREHNENYALRVGVNRAASTFYQYRNTYCLLSKFIESKYKVSDITVKSLDKLFKENFHQYLRIDPIQKPNTIRGHTNRLKYIGYIAVSRSFVAQNPFMDFSPDKLERKQLYLTQDELSRLMNATFDTRTGISPMTCFSFQCLRASVIVICATCRKKILSGTRWLSM